MVSWMYKRYTRSMDLNSITKRHNDSSTWRVIMRKKDNANKCADLGANDTMTWRGRGSTPTLANINSTLRERHPKDGYATGIWLS